MLSLASVYENALEPRAASDTTAEMLVRTLIPLVTQLDIGAVTALLVLADLRQDSQVKSGVVC